MFRGIGYRAFSSDYKCDQSSSLWHVKRFSEIPSSYLARLKLRIGVGGYLT